MVSNMKKKCHDGNLDMSGSEDAFIIQALKDAAKKLC